MHWEKLTRMAEGRKNSLYDVLITSWVVFIKPTGLYVLKRNKVNYNNSTMDQSHEYVDKIWYLF